MNFNTRFPEPRLPRWLLAVYLITIAACWVLVSTWDYQDARARECAGQTNSKYSVTYDADKDVCIKERKHGTAKKD